MRKSIRKNRIGARFVACQAAIVLLWLLPAAHVLAAEEEFPEGMTEGEKTLMLQEMQEDIERDAPAYVDPSAEVEEPTDEEAEQMIRDALPSEEELDKLAERYEDRVLSLASFRTDYDTKNGLYRYLLPSGGAISVSAPLGGWTEHAVALVPEDGVALISVVRDGEAVTETAGEDGTYFFRDPGQYAFMAYDEKGVARDYISGTFRIVDVRIPVTDAVISAPEGYRISQVQLNGSPVGERFIDPGCTELSADGRYEVSFRAADRLSGLPETFTVNFTRDTTPPILIFEGDVRDGLFVSEVHYTVPEPDTEVEIWYNGQAAVSPTQVLAAAGSYYLTATDPTGNVQTYNFIIERQTQVPWIFIGIVAGVFALAAVILIATAGRGMRIR